MITLLFHSEVDRREWWNDEFARHRTDINLVTLDDLDSGGVAAEAIDYALLWKPPAGLTARLPSLKAIFSLGAGIDHLLSDPDLRRDVPMTRVVDPNLTARMTEYVVLHVLRHQWRDDEETPHAVNDGRHCRQQLHSCSDRSAQPRRAELRQKERHTEGHWHRQNDGEQRGDDRAVD
jgi:glyoxylate/hydroxypyruvate reductase A